MNRRLVRWHSLAFVATLVLALGAMPPVAAVSTPDADTISLFNGKDLTGWRAFLDPNAKVEPSKIWSVENGIIKCEGSVPGYIITENEYGDYVLKLEWRWGEKPGRGRNSGVLLHTQPPDKVWPKSVEAQLMAGQAGDFWLIDAKLTVDEARRDPRVNRHFFRMIKSDVEKPIGEWNQYVITCRGDTIKLEINGKLVNEGTNAEFTKGRIALQSEGAEIHFRNLTITPLK